MVVRFTTTLYKNENKLGAVEGRDRMVVGFITTCILRREQVRERP
jgi:hypothetical protein